MSAWHPHIVIFNARIFDPLTRRVAPATALAVWENRIVAIGLDHEMRELAGPATLQLDARRHWLLPGLVDSHIHLTEFALRRQELDFSNCSALEEALELVRRAVEARPAGSWITGGGWDVRRLGLSGFPDRAWLDAISQDHLMVFASRDWHSVWVNSPVLERAGIDAHTPDPEGGKILRRNSGKEPTGVLQEKACQMVYGLVPPAEFEQVGEALNDVFAEFHRQGITAVHVMETPREWRFYQLLRQQRQLQLRISWYAFVEHLDALKHSGLASGLGDAWLQVGGIKIFVDGSLGSQTAEMLAPYQGLDHAGVEVRPEAELTELVEEATANGLACAIHAIGDRANRKALNAIEKARERYPSREVRHRIEHAQLLHPEDLPRFVRLNVIASMQPIHLAEDVPAIEALWGERGRYAFAFQSLLARGTRLTFGSDAPVERINPWQGMFMAVTRKAHLDPAQPTFYPEESISLAEAVAAYTIHPHYAVGLEYRLGRITPGNLADFIIVDQDVFNDPPETLLENQVLLTCLDGQIVYRRSGEQLIEL